MGRPDRVRFRRRGTDAIAWYEINLSGTPTITQQGLISDPNLFFYYPSLSADRPGNVVIGFSGSDATQSISSYAVYGTTNSLGVTTFSGAMLLKQGTGVFVGNLLTPQPTAPVTSTTQTTPPTVSLTPSSSSFSESGAGDTDTITARISTPAPAGGVTIALGFSGTAVANLDYTIGTNGVNNAVLTSSLPVEIFIPQGQTTGSITLTGASNPDVVSNESLNVSVISVNGVVPSTPVQANLSIGNTGFPIISIENLTVTEPNASSTAQVTVQLSGSSSTPLTIEYMTATEVTSPGGNRCGGRLGSASGLYTGADPDDSHDSGQHILGGDPDYGHR